MRLEKSKHLRVQARLPKPVRPAVKEELPQQSSLHGTRAAAGYSPAACTAGEHCHRHDERDEGDSDPEAHGFPHRDLRSSEGARPWASR